MRYQPIYDLAEVCARKGLSQTILCPGSRCAPLTLAFVRHKDIVTRTFSDERSAGFVAVGIAQQTKVPAILVCTSGSAAYNFAPAIAEAYYQQVPLLIFTADRPSEWVDQLDGQTIRQPEIFGKHVKRSFELPEDYSHPDAYWHINRIANEAINLAQEFPKGPVHINAPFREPLYPAKGESIRFSDSIRIINQSTVETSPGKQVQETIAKDFASFNKVLMVAGQDDYNENLVRVAERFVKHQHVALVGDVISNFHGIPETVRHADAFLGQGGEGLKKSLKPELLITFGKSVISKNLKLFLRAFKPEQHWHLQPAGSVADTFQSLTNVIPFTPLDFMESFVDTGKSSTFEAQKRENYYRLWEAEDHRIERSMETFFGIQQLSELHLVRDLLQSLPPRCNLHLANSMSVRYANLIGLSAARKGIRVYSNRGTSGIDGCTSTAVGHALSSDVPNFLITGDMAFFYDRNAFWHNYQVPNLHILVLNNHGGTIFNMIDGPSDAPEKDEYFVTKQSLTASHLAEEFGFEYLLLDSLKKHKNTLKAFCEFSRSTKILELDTEASVNKDTFERFKQQIRKGYE